jgi:chromate transport protein ChrA
MLLRDGDKNPVVAGLLNGLRPAVAALLAYTCWQLCEPPLRQYRGLRRLAWAAVLVGVAVPVLLGWLHPAWAVLAGGAAGALLAPVVIEALPAPSTEPPLEGGSR